MSAGSSANSWTILTPEESATETLRPLTEVTGHHDESPTSTAGSAENQPANGTEPADKLPVEGYLVSKDKTTKLNGDGSTDAAAPCSLEMSHSFTPGLPEEPDSFSDSCTNITPSSDEASASLLNTETLGRIELVPKDERHVQEETLHLNGEGLQKEGADSDLCQRMTDKGNLAAPASIVESEVGEQKPISAAEVGDLELRRRRSLLAALERIGRAEEEEEKEEEFQLPQPEAGSGFSVNKCILGALILLGLGTIFFSGFFMDLDEESDFGTRELRDAELPGKQEWLSAEVPSPQVDSENTELLDKLAKGNRQISELQAQLRAQKEELKVAMGQAADGAKDQLWWEELEKENSRLKEEMASFLVLQEENQRMKKELEALPALQKELERLRGTVTESKLSAASEEPVKASSSPPSGQKEDSTQDAAGFTDKTKKPWDDQRENHNDVRKHKRDMGKKEEKEREKTQWKEREKTETKGEGKAERKMGKHEEGKFNKEKYDKGKQKRSNEESEQWKDKGWKKEKVNRGDEGKSWKDRDDNKEWKHKSERKEWKEEKDWKKAKQVNEGKGWRGMGEKRDWEGRIEHREKHNSRKEKEGYEESGKEKWERQDWKQKGEEKEWKKDREWKNKNNKDLDKEQRWKGEKQWERSKNHGKDRKGKGERKQHNENEWESKNGKYDEEKKREEERKHTEWKSKDGKYDEERKREDDRKHTEWKSKDGKYEKDWKRRDERKHFENNQEQWKRRGHEETKDWGKDRSGSHKDERKFAARYGHHEEHLWGDRKPSHSHHRPSVEQPEYWVNQRTRLQRNPKPPQHCNSVENCAQTEGLPPVRFPEFEAILQTYLAKAEAVGVGASVREELRKLTAEFFKDGLFVHNQMSFQDFIKDLGDVLEDMVEGEEDDDDDEEDSAIEEEMEAFEREVMKKFSPAGAGGKDDRSKGEWRKQSGRG